MVSLTRAYLIDAAARIGHRLAADAVWTGDACTWSVITVDPARPNGYVSARAPAGGVLYQGTSGIALFFAELWRLTQEERFRQCSWGALRKALSKDVPPLQPFSLYSGATGVAYVASRLTEITNTDEWAGVPAAIVRHVASIADSGIPGDVIGGGAGTVLGMLRLSRDLVGDVGISTAERVGENLEEYAVVRPYGWSWRYGGWSVKHDLCGYAHGASGYAHAFLELFAATGAARWRHAAQRALLYERRHRSKEALGDWPDFRDMGLWNWSARVQDGATLRAEVRAKGSVKLFPTATMRAWCHGGPGIALTRLRAASLGVEAAECAAEARDALNRTAETLAEMIPRGYSLCHGVFGNAEALMHGRRRAGLDHADVVHARVEEGINLFELSGRPWPSGALENAPDPSLLLGDAGIGLFLLQLADATVPSVTFLSDWTGSPPTPADDTCALRCRDASAFLSMYDRVATRLSAPSSTSVTAAVAGGADTPEEVLRAVESTVGTIRSDAVREMLTDALIPEAAYLREHLAFEDFRPQHIGELLTLAVEEIDWSTARIELAPEVKIVNTRWAWRDWLDTGTSLPQPDGETYALHRRSDFVVLTPLTPFDALIVDLIREPKTVASLLMSVEAATDLTAEAREMLPAAVREALRQAVIAGIARASGVAT